MEKVAQLKERLSNERPVPWDDLPDISLYKDQVVSYMQRQLISFEDEAQLTSAMINNYIKDKLLPRAEGKKYNRGHLAALTEIRVLKPILSVKDIGLLLDSDFTGRDQVKFYEEFRVMLDEALGETSEKIKPSQDIEALTDMALKLAISSYSQKLACIRLIDIIRSAAEEEMEKDSGEEKASKKDEKKKQSSKDEQDKQHKNKDKNKDKNKSKTKEKEQTNTNKE